jgi:hypothetical protein
LPTWTCGAKCNHRTCGDGVWGARVTGPRPVVSLVHERSHERDHGLCAARSTGEMVAAIKPSLAWGRSGLRLLVAGAAGVAVAGCATSSLDDYGFRRGLASSPGARHRRRTSRDRDGPHGLPQCAVQGEPLAAATTCGSRRAYVQVAAVPDEREPVGRARSHRPERCCRCVRPRESALAFVEASRLHCGAY